MKYISSTDKGMKSSYTLFNVIGTLERDALVGGYAVGHVEEKQTNIQTTLNRVENIRHRNYKL